MQEIESDTYDVKDCCRCGGRAFFWETAIVPGDPEKSAIVKAIRYDDITFQMPPKAKLSDAEMVNIGIGPRMELTAQSTLSIVRPTRTFTGHAGDKKVSKD